MASGQSERIKIWGIVQGVGFRPFVAKLASVMGLKGQVINIGGLVEIVVTDSRAHIDEFIDRIYAEKPLPAEIVHISRQIIPRTEFDTFTIADSISCGDEIAMIPPDMAICPQCLEELRSPENPRFEHPFISCMLCGPRYTIMNRIPYDRDNTTMDDFPLCDFCLDQYTDISNRRYHAQTISCRDCGPQLIWRDRDSRELLSSDKDILDVAATRLKTGDIIAFKCVGGYNLVADPFNISAVNKLRKIKNRPHKPFAILFSSLDEIKKYCHVNEVEANLLSSSSRPIILLEHKDTHYEEIKKSRFIGSFLPSLAAQYLLLDRISPLIFTSANISDAPMLSDDSAMTEMMVSQSNISGVLYNKRRILVPIDDSVARVIDNQPQMIRRSKGYAPTPLYIIPSNHKIFAAGGQLKNSFALTNGAFAYMSQYFGDLDTLSAQNMYNNNLYKMMDLFNITPNVVVCDSHPLYYSSSFARKYANSNGLKCIEAQHHHAHIASVMAEHQLTDTVLGVSFDGTGYGSDGCIWGGEFLLCHDDEYKRISHLEYVDMISGDSSIKDAYKSALSYIHQYKSSDKTHHPDELHIDLSNILEYCRSNKTISTDDEKASMVFKALSSGINTLKSSSMGRLFDSVSALLGICNYNHYEGQCAIMLEDAAAFSQKTPGENEACDLALEFHNQIINLIVSQCLSVRDKYNVNKIALSGGTFQNKILMDGVLSKLRANNFSPYYNISVSPNDGGLALGQAYIAMMKLK